MEEPDEWRGALVYGGAVAGLRLLTNVVVVLLAAFLDPAAVGFVGPLWLVLELLLGLGGSLVAGALATRLYVRQLYERSNYAMSYGQGALVGGRCGIVVAFVAFFQGMVGYTLGDWLGVPPDALAVGGVAPSPVSYCCAMGFNVALGVIGGWIGVLVFRRR